MDAAPVANERVADDRGGNNPTAVVVYGGGCHCGAVRFQVTAPATPVLYACNCSLCDKVGYLHLIVDAGALQVIQGRDVLSEYRFNTGLAQHWFCRHCGVKPFYVPRSHPQGYSVNGRCLDHGVWRQWRVEPFDGRNWEQAVQVFAAPADD